MIPGVMDVLPQESVSGRELIPGGEGTLLGNMTSNGGLAACFDGDTDKTQGEGAFISATDGTVGKQYNSLKPVRKWKAWGCSTVGFNNQPVNGSCSLSIQYSSDGSTWFTADAVSVNAVPGTVDRTFAAVGSFFYWQVKISQAGSDKRCAQVEFYT